MAINIITFSGGNAGPSYYDPRVGITSMLNQSLYSYSVNNNLGFATDPEYAAAPPNSTTTEALAVTNNAYVYFTITPNAGVTINYTAFKLSTAKGQASTPRGYGVRSSIDAYAADLYTEDVTVVSPNWNTMSIGLGTAFKGKIVPVTFRIYFYSPSNSQTMLFDDVAVDGEIIQGYPKIRFF
jgi:hypothetical protein